MKIDMGLIMFGITCMCLGMLVMPAINEFRTVEGLGFVIKEGTNINGERLMFTQTSRVSCETDSMSPAFNCKDTLLELELSEEENLSVGSIYVYKDEGLVFHRLVACMNENCSKLLFKGDNNIYPDKIINRSQIESIVVGVLYES